MSKSPAEDPVADPQVIATVRFLRGRIPPGARVAAPARFADALGPLSPPVAALLPDWAVVVTDGPEATPLPLVRQLLAQSTPVHANGRYVVFTRRPTFGLMDQRDTPEVRALAERAATAGATGDVPSLPSLIPVPAETVPAAPPVAVPAGPPPAHEAEVVRPLPENPSLLEASTASPPPRLPATRPEARSTLPPTPWGPLSRTVPAVPGSVPVPAIPGAKADPFRPTLPPEALAAARGAWHRPAVPVPGPGHVLPPIGPVPSSAVPPRTAEPVLRPLAAPTGAVVTAPSLPAAVPPWAPAPAPAPTGLPGRILSLIGGEPVRRVATFGDAAALAGVLPSSLIVSPASEGDDERAVQLVLVMDPDVEALPDILAHAARLLRPAGLAVIVVENAESLGRRLARALGREPGGGLTAARLRAAVRAAGFRPGLMEGFSLDPWRATADTPPAAFVEGPAGDLLDAVGRDAGPDHAARLLLLARLT